MPTVTGAPTTAGTYNGAAELLRSFVKNGKYPASWFRVKPGTVIETVGPYTIRSDAAGSVTVSWPGNRKNWINVLFKNDGTPDPKFPLVRGDAKDDRSLLDKIFGINLGNPATNPGAAQNAIGLGKGANAVGSGITSVAGLIGAITDPTLWKRIGIGAAGVAILIVAIVFWLKES